MSDPLPAGAQIVSGRAALADRLAEVIASAQTELALLSLSLARDIYAREAVLESLKRFVLHDEHARVRVLVADARTATAGGNPFLDLARRLPSRIQLRELTPEKRESDGPERLIADRRRMVDLPGQARLDATYHPQPAPAVLERLKEFDALWDESGPVLELSGMQF